MVLLPPWRLFPHHDEEAGPRRPKVETISSIPSLYISQHVKAHLGFAKGGPGNSRFGDPWLAVQQQQHDVEVHPFR
jgi:hypothetical protein